MTATLERHDTRVVVSCGNGRSIDVQVLAGDCGCQVLFASAPRHDCELDNGEVTPGALLAPSLRVGAAVIPLESEAEIQAVGGLLYEVAANAD